VSRVGPPGEGAHPWPTRLARTLAPWAVEAVIVVGMIFLYQLTKLRTDVSPAVALEHARDVAAFERGLGLFVEPAIHRAILDHTVLMPVLRWLYLNLHFPVTLGFLIWVRYSYAARYPRIRNGFAFAHVIALVVFVAYPCAPPRMFPELGFMEVLNLPYEGTHNPYAVIPSMHFGYATLVGGGLIWLARAWSLRVLGAFYMALILFIIVATAAHFWIDAPLGALTVGLGLALAGAFKRDAGAP